MAQFDIYRIAGHGLVLDCQSDVLNDLRSRVVAPLREEGEVSVGTSRLHPPVVIEGQRYRVATQFLRAVDVRQLSDRIGSAADQEYVIKAALDMLISGF